MVIDIILSVVFGLVVAFCAASVMQLVTNDGSLSYYEVDDDGEAEKKFAGFNMVGDGWYWAICTGVILGTINFFAPKIAGALWLAPIFLIVMVAFYVALMIWWHKEGGEWQAIIPVIVLAVLAFLVTCSAASMVAIMIPMVFWKSLVMVLPGVLLTLTIGFLFTDLWFFQYHEIDREGSRASTRDHVLGWVGAVLTTLSIVSLLVTGVAWGSFAVNTVEKAYGSDDGGSTTVPTTNSWVHYYNLDLQNNGDKSDNFNFGPNPWTNGATAEQMYAVMYNRMKEDPKLAAAVLANCDASWGTRFLGEFYDECDEHWDATINAAAEEFANNQTSFYAHLYAWDKFVSDANLEIRDCESVNDQMWMNPYTVSGVPDVIVRETSDHSGHELVIVPNIKGDTSYTAAFRIECGLQPTDVSEKMHLEAEPEPTPTPDPKPDPKPEPDPEPVKDPSKLTPINTEPNDNKGPGENTIDPSDLNHSTKDRDDNSTSYSNYDEYKDQMDHLAEVNETQKVGGDSNQPSTETPSGTTVDNNADKGTGNGGIDKLTSKSDLAETADTGEAITNNSSNAATAWGDGEDPK